MCYKRILLSLLLILCCSNVSADIMLKKNFFGSWKYSINGERYKNVGFSGSDLSDAMWGNERAQQQMKKYRTAKTFSLITAIPGGFLIGWPIGAYIGSGGEWKDSYTTMLIVGAPLAMASIILEGIANRKIKKAVRIYNDTEESFSFNIAMAPIKSGQPTTVMFRLKYGF